ncbi:MAG: hypothetical protein V4668_02550 [Patescibacteria group bacterium]
MFGFRKKNKSGSFSVETSKKVVFSRARSRVDGIVRKGKFTKEGIQIEKEKKTIEKKFDNKKRTFAPSRLRVDGIFRKEKFIREGIKTEERFDNKKRTFLKVAGVAGLGLAATTLLPKAASAYVAGSTPTSNVVGLKDDTNTRINPATEETVASLLKTSDLTFDAGALQVKVTSVSGAGSSSFSDSGDVAKSGLVDGDRHLQVDVLSSSLPTSASTETTLQTISFGGFKFALRLVTVGSIDYLGEATIGSTTSSAVWRVKKIDSTTGISITWAGAGVFDQVWDNYSSLTYT